MSRVELAEVSPQARTLAAAYHAAFAEWPHLSMVGGELVQAAASPGSPVRGLARDTADALAELLRARLADEGYADLLAGTDDPCAREREQTMQQIEARLAAGLALIPGVVYASVFGSWAARRLRDRSDLDLLCVLDLQDDSPAYDAALDRIYDLVREVEKEAWPLARDIHVVDRALSDWQARCAAPSGFVVDVYAKQRIELLSSFESGLPESTVSLLRERAAAFLARERTMGPLDPGVYVTAC